MFHLRIKFATSWTEGHVLTNCTDPSFSGYYLNLLVISNKAGRMAREQKMLVIIAENTIYLIRRRVNSYSPLPIQIESGKLCAESVLFSF